MKYLIVAYLSLRGPVVARHWVRFREPPINGIYVLSIDLRFVAIQQYLRPSPIAYYLVVIRAQTLSIIVLAY